MFSPHEDAAPSFNVGRWTFNVQRSTFCPVLDNFRLVSRPATSFVYLMSSQKETNQLLSIRDWLRHGVSLMTREKCSFGQGFTSALEESAFLLQFALDLPREYPLEPYLDARVLPSPTAACRRTH